MKTINIIGVVIILLFIGGAFFFGYRTYPKYHPCKTTSDTIVYHDTVEHHIVDSFPYYVEGSVQIVHDTVPRDVDTAKILQDYYDLHIYPRKWENDSVEIHLLDTITRNKFLHNDFSYRLKFPTSTVINNVDNSVHYDRYVQFGIGIPFKDVHYIQLETNYIFPKGYVGGYWEPELKSFGVKGGVTLIKIKR